MKKLFATLVCVLAIAGLVAVNSGCKSVVTTDPITGISVTNKVVNSEAIIPVLQTTIPLAVQVAIAKDTNSVAYFKATTVVLDTLAAGGNYDPMAVAAALNSLKANTPEAQLAVMAGLSIYKSFASEAVNAKLNSAQFAAVLKAFSDSIKTGLAFAGVNSTTVASSGKVSVIPVRSGTNTIPVKVK
jgi:hypothetical protein